MTEVDRFVRRFVELLQARAPGSIHAPLSVGELRTTVMPYRTNRTAVGVASADDYDGVVLRIVAEEGGYVRTLPPGSAERCRAELGGPHPDLGLLDQLAETTIQIGAASLARILALEPEAPTEPVAAAGASSPLADLPLIDVSEAFVRSAPAPEVPPSPPSAPASPAVVRPPPPPPAPPSLGRRSEGEPAATAPAPADPVTKPLERIAASGGGGKTSVESPVPSGRCRSCRELLPAGKPVRFCPFCGSRVEPTVCPVCHADVEPGWRHCIGCGTRVGDDPALA